MQLKSVLKEAFVWGSLCSYGILGIYVYVFIEAYVESEVWLVMEVSKV